MKTFKVLFRVSQAHLPTVLAAVSPECELLRVDPDEDKVTHHKHVREYLTSYGYAANTASAALAELKKKGVVTRSSDDVWSMK